MFKETQPICVQMPVELDGFELTDFKLRCQECNEPIPEALTHGYVTQPQPNLVAFHAVCICNECNVIAEGVQRYRKTDPRTIRVETLTNEGWKNTYMIIQEIPWPVRFMRKLFGFNSD